MQPSQGIIGTKGTTETKGLAGAPSFKNNAGLHAAAASLRLQQNAGLHAAAASLGLPMALTSIHVGGDTAGSV